jgi:serine/threonine-protein kinase RsbW
MDWLIDRQHPESTERALALLDDHLRRHAASDEGVHEAVEAVRTALASVPHGSGVLRLHLDWRTERPHVVVSPVTDDVVAEGDGIGSGVRARDKARLDESTREALARIALEVDRQAQDTFTDGPPPMGAIDADPRRDGMASVAVALVRAAADHPTANPSQQASLAGAALADSVATDQPPTDGPAVARLLADTHRALGGEVEILTADDEVVEVAVARCPFGHGVPDGEALCHVTSGLAGRLGARVNGSATVVLTERIVDGDQECHLQMWLGTPNEEVVGERHVWPPTAGSAGSDEGAVPRLDLSVNLPRETVSVPVVRRLAAQALHAFGVAEDDIADVQLAIGEACANVIDHASDTDTYEVQVELAADRCAITVVDHGSGFDGSAVPGGAGDSAESGRGLTLMHALVDNVAFRNEPQAGTVVHMVKSLRYDATHPLRQGSALRG